MKCARRGCEGDATVAAQLAVDLQARADGSVRTSRVFVGRRDRPMVACADHHAQEERNPEGLFQAGLERVVSEIAKAAGNVRVTKRVVLWLPLDHPDFVAWTATDDGEE